MHDVVDAAETAAEERDWDRAAEIVRAQHPEVEPASDRFWELVLREFKQAPPAAPESPGKESRMGKAITGMLGWLRRTSRPAPEHAVMRLFGKARVKAPGSRGGKFYYDAHGRIQYGEAPSGHAGFENHAEFSAAHELASPAVHRQRAEYHDAQAASESNEHHAKAHRHLAEAHRSTADAKEGVVRGTSTVIELKRAIESARAGHRSGATNFGASVPGTARGTLSKCFSTPHRIDANGDLSLLR